jgi:hypothetical protein
MRMSEVKMKCAKDPLSPWMLLDVGGQCRRRKKVFVLRELHSDYKHRQDE